ncbi:MAG: RNA polymerase sigma factor [Planctomycetota bacterium]
MNFLSDQELINLCREGKPEAFTVLYERYRQTIMNFAYRILRDSHLSADVLQETFIYVFKKLPTYESRAKFTTLLFQVARHISFNKLKKIKHLKIQPLPEEISGPDTEINSNPEKILQNEEIGKNIAGALKQLPLLYREVINLRIIQNLPYREISAILDCPLGTVKSRLHNGLEMLRTYLRSKIEQNKE